ncbi:MAG: histidine kinase, partial [Acidobacteria bacterium]|nr:histidine kinase [Acidobacteriota bacterium]
TLALVALVWGARQHWRIRRTTAELSAAHHELAGARLELANEAERERRRIARDLHDQTLADLRSLLLLTDQLPKAVTEGTNGHQPQAQLATVDPATFRAEIESVSNEIRRICEDLSPSALENVGLAAALEWALANAVAHLPEERKFKYQFSCQDELEEGVDFAPGVRMQIYRIAQEAINNVCRHAAATRVSLAVSLSQTGELRLTLEDDGRGFDARNHQAQQGRGVVRYQPGREFPSLVPARVLSRRLHTPAEMSGGIDLGYPQNSLALDVAALSSRTYPEQFQYAFFLRDGAGKEIKRKLSRDSQFVMENLAPGRYTVEAVAFTKDLVASSPLA